MTGISHELEQLLSDFTLWGMTLKTESSGGERPSMPRPEIPAYGQLCFPAWGAAVTLGDKAWPLSKSPLHKSMCGGSGQRQAWCEAQAAVPMKPFGDSDAGTREPVLSPFV